eukprot:20635-Heterococcus_DN1.PRE.3
MSKAIAAICCTMQLSHFDCHSTVTCVTDYLHPSTISTMLSFFKYNSTPEHTVLQRLPQIRREPYRVFLKDCFMFNTLNIIIIDYSHSILRYRG